MRGMEMVMKDMNDKKVNWWVLLWYLIYHNNYYFFYYLIYWTINYKTIKIFLRTILYISLSFPIQNTYYTFFLFYYILFKHHYQYMIYFLNIIIWILFIILYKVIIVIVNIVDIRLLRRILIKVMGEDFLCCFHVSLGRFC